MPNLPAGSNERSQRPTLERRAPVMPPGTDARLERRISRLEQALASMASEVRTRRLVVVDQYGSERIIGEALNDMSDDSARLVVQSPDGYATVGLHSSMCDDVHYGPC